MLKRLSFSLVHKNARSEKEREDGGSTDIEGNCRINRQDGGKQAERKIKE